MQSPDPLTSHSSTSSTPSSESLSKVPSVATPTVPSTVEKDGVASGSVANSGVAHNVKNIEKCDTERSHSTLERCCPIDIPEPEPLESAPLSTYQEFVLRAKRNGSDGFVDLGHGLVLVAKGVWQLCCSAGQWSWVGILRLPEWLRSFRHTPNRIDDDAIALNPTTFEPLPPLAPNAASLTIYGVPLRLVAVIVASAGNQHKIASYAELLESFEQAVPGFAKVLKTHKPKIVPWGAQLSTTGFAAKFHANVTLPDANELAANSEQEYGLRNGSHWCSVVGPMRRGDQVLLVGLLLHSDILTTVGRCTTENPQLWRTFCSIR